MTTFLISKFARIPSQGKGLRNKAGLPSVLPSLMVRGTDNDRVTYTDSDNLRPDIKTCFKEWSRVSKDGAHRETNKISMDAHKD